MADQESCSRVEQRSVIKFLVAEGCKPSVNSANYCELLKKVKKDVKNKRRGRQSQGVILHEDNARPHTAVQTVRTISDLGWELLPHPPYCPDLAPSDFHLFGPLKDFTRGTKSKLL